MNTDLAFEYDPIEPLSGSPPVLPPPRVGDLLTLYPLPTAAPWLGMKYSTLTENIRRGRIPRQYLTRTPGRVFMTGDQILRLLAYFAEVDWSAQPTTVPAGARPHATRASSHRQAS